MKLKSTINNWKNAILRLAAPKTRVPLPAGRESYEDIKASFLYLDRNLKFVDSSFEFRYVPLIRKLVRVNSSVSQALNTIVELSNPGFTIQFDKSVKEEQATLMRQHIENVAKKWTVAAPGLHGLINKLIAQIYIGGAISGEWVIKNDLSGIKNFAIINPETIRAAYNTSIDEYEYYQAPENWWDLKTVPPDSLIKLNPFTFQYLILVNDEQAPRPVSPFLSALDDLKSQIQMLKNIGYVSDQLGLMGFLEILLAKPGVKDGESDTAYGTRMSALLRQSKDNIKEGLKDGIVAGFKEDHEFNFHSTTKDTNGVAEIFDINQRMVANGLFINPQFLGGGSGGTETMLSIVFTKMLSQLYNVQTYVGEVITQGLAFELLLAGFTFKKVSLKFNAATVTDNLKLQQAREIKVRVNRVLWSDGVISLSQYAQDLGYDEPDQEEPRNPIDPDKTTQAQEAIEKDNKQDAAGDKTTREKKKTQPKRK